MWGWGCGKKETWISCFSTMYPGPRAAVQPARPQATEKRKIKEKKGGVEARSTMKIVTGSGKPAKAQICGKSRGSAEPIFSGDGYERARGQSRCRCEQKPFREPPLPPPPRLHPSPLPC